MKKTEKRKFPAIICLVRECIFSSNDDFVFTLMIDKSIGVLRRKYRRKIKCNSFAYSMTLVYNFLKSKYVYIQLIIAVTNCIFFTYIYFSGKYRYKYHCPREIQICVVYHSERKPITVDCYKIFVSNSDTQTKGGLPLHCCIWKITRYRNLLAPLKVSGSDTRTMAACWGER